MSIESKLKYPDDEIKRIKNFYKLLDKYTDIMAEQLYDRYKFQCTALKKQFPLLMSGMWLDSENLKENDAKRVGSKTWEDRIWNIGQAVVVAIVIAVALWFMKGGAIS